MKALGCVYKEDLLTSERKERKAKEVERRHPLKYMPVPAAFEDFMSPVANAFNDAVE